MTKTNNYSELFELLKTKTPTGEEYRGSDVWKNKVKNIEGVDVSNSNYGNTYAFLKSKIQTKETVVIEAHIDEISWMITKIETSGLIRVKRNGGSDQDIAPGQKGHVILDDGKLISGVFGYPAIHTRKQNNKEHKIDELFFDVGFDSKKEVEKLKIHVGQLILFDVEPTEIGDYICGKALDNKLGGYIILQVLKQIVEFDLPYNLLVANCIAEEVGLYGAKHLVQDYKHLDIKAAIVIDVTHHTTTPGINTSIEGVVECGKGAVIEHNASYHRKLVNLLRQTAIKNKIPFQDAPGGFGNDTVSFYEAGIPTSIISIPLKYMHTTVEMSHKKDIENIIKLYVETLKEIKLSEINYN